MTSVFDRDLELWFNHAEPDDLADVPAISPVLLKALEARFSPPRPTAASTTAEDKYHAGAWSVVE